MRFDYCKANLNTACEEHKYDHCEMCNIARAYEYGYRTAQENAPTIDAVEVIRCKDCKNRARYAVCDFLGEDGFCPHGERREDGEE